MINNDSYKNIVEAITANARQDNYKGYNKHDGLNSPIIRALSPHKYLRLVGIQSVMRSPINLRPLFLVPKTINAKGMSLWAVTYMNLYTVTKQEEYLNHARECLDWLLNNHSQGKKYSGLCWGYPYPWQDVGFFAPEGMPNCVVSCFVGRALLQAYEIMGDERYLKAATSLCQFFLNDLTKIQDTEDMLCLSYAPVEMDWVVMDTSALSAIVLAKTGKHSGNEDFVKTSTRLMNYVVDKKTDYHAWFYSHPAERSHITHDNYHTGYIVDAILDYTDATGDKQFWDSYEKGLKYYQDNLFESDGAPRWMNDKQYPYDIHGCAQGIISFAKAAKINPEYLEQAKLCAEWAIENMYVPSEARFYYQKRPLYITKFTLLRWCNAWMARALSELALTESLA